MLVLFVYYFPLSESAVREGTEDFRVNSPSDRLSVGWLNGKGYHESRRCSKNTYPESYITEVN